MKKGLRWLALVLVLAALGVWGVTGADRGWTKTNIPVEIKDEVTGLTGYRYEKGFVAGVDFLGGSALVSLALAGCSFLFPNKKSGA